MTVAHPKQSGGNTVEETVLVSGARAALAVGRGQQPCAVSAIHLVSEDESAAAVSSIMEEDG